MGSLFPSILYKFVHANDLNEIYLYLGYFSHLDNIELQASMLLNRAKLTKLETKAVMNKYGYCQSQQ